MHTFNYVLSSGCIGRLSAEIETDPSFQRAQLHRQAADALPFAHEGENEEQGECVRFISPCAFYHTERAFATLLPVFIDGFP
jgi:hypothetical protein